MKSSGLELAAGRRVARQPVSHGSTARRGKRLHPVHPGSNGL